MANCKPVYGNKYIIDKLETGCLKVNNKLVDKKNQPLVRWFVETDNGIRPVDSNETLTFSSNTLDISLDEEKNAVTFETKQENQVYTSIQLNSNTSCLVPKDFYLVQIQSAIVDCKEDVVVDLVVDGNLVKQYTLACIPSNQNQRALYLNYIGEYLTRGQLLEINSTQGAEFILYFGEIPNPPFQSVNRSFLFDVTPQNSLFYQSNVTDVLDDIFT